MGVLGRNRPPGRGLALWLHHAADATVPQAVHTHTYTHIYTHTHRAASILSTQESPDQAEVNPPLWRRPSATCIPDTHTHTHAHT